MTYETFVHKNFRADALAIIERADTILSEFQNDSYTLTLRQLYYQFVSKGLIENTERSYKRLGAIVTDARMAGLLSWDAIEDRGRNMQRWAANENMNSILSDLPYKFAADYWADQDYYIEVWVEKDALVGVVERACVPRRVPHMACKGYLSASEAYRAGKRFERAVREGKQPLVIHLGDHDPSGIDMTRDNEDRLGLFSYSDVEVRRVALNMDQIDHYNPPPNPTKITDSRAHSYIANHGMTSWELDALEPPVIVDLIQREIEPLIDVDLWEQARARQEESRDLLRRLRLRWDEVADLLRTEEDYE